VIDSKEMTRPLAEPDDDLVEAFWENVYKGELRFQRCEECGTWRHLPRHLCANCRSAKWTWAESKGRGKVFSWTITHQPLVRNFPEDVPYAVVVVELEEGVRMVSGLRGLHPSKLELDLPLEVVFEEVGDGKKIALFRPRYG